MSDSTNKAEAESSQLPTQQKQNPQVLEEDDEFEDFPVEGELRFYVDVVLAYWKLFPLSATPQLRKF